MVQNRYSSTVSALLMVAFSAEVQLVQAQSQFKRPDSVPQGTTLRISGSSSMKAVNDVLKQRFEKQYAGTQVNLANTGTPASLQAVLNGKADLAAIGRPLTEQEKAQGLVAVPIGRDKIAIVVGANNPLAKTPNKSLTIDQFAKLFRGEIKNWSEVGGPSLPVKFVDRPDSSDTRQALKNYPVFKQGKFATGATAKKLSEDTTQAVVQNLGNNGISYATANQLKGITGAKAVTMNGTQPSSGRYPFSQPLYYVYKGQTSPAVQAFLGYATAPVGQTAIAQAGVADAIAAPKSGAAATGTSGQSGDKAAPYNAPGGQPGPAGLVPSDNAGNAGLPNWLWWLLPIGSAGVLAWMLGRGRRRDREVGAIGSFNAPDNPDRTPYAEGGFDPLQPPDRDYAESNFEAPDPDRVEPAIDPPANSSNSTNANVGLGGAALAGGAATLAGLSGRAKSRVVLKSRTSQEAEAFWDIPAEERQSLRQHGGEKLALRLYDVTNVDLDRHPAHSVQQFDCDELTQRQRLPIALADRDYLVEIGYLTAEGHWLDLARSVPVHVPPSKSNGGRVPESARPVLDHDRDSQLPDVTLPTEQSPPWLQVVTRIAPNSTEATEVAPRPEPASAPPPATEAVGGQNAAWTFLSGQPASNRESFKPSQPAPEPIVPTNTAIRPDATPITQRDERIRVAPTGLEEGRLVLTPRNARWAYATWDIPRSLRSRFDLSAGEQLMLRLYDVTDTGSALPERFEQYDIDDRALSCDVPIPAGDRTYVAEIGYLDASQHWTKLTRSTPAHVPQA